MNKYLIEILKIQSSVILPGLGALMVPSQKSGKIVFNPHLKFNDGSLARFIAEKEGVDEQESQNKVAKFVREIEAEIGKGNSYDMFEFGNFFKNKDGEVDFTMYVAGAENKNVAVDKTKVDEKPEKKTVVTPADIIAKDKKKPVTKKEKTTKTEPKKKTTTAAEKKETKKATEEKAADKQAKNKFIPPVVDDVKEKLDEVKETAEKKVEKAKEKIEDKIDKVEEKVEKKVEEVKEETTKKTAEIKKEVEKKVEKVIPPVVTDKKEEKTPTEDKQSKNTFVPPTDSTKDTTDTKKSESKAGVAAGAAIAAGATIKAGIDAASNDTKAKTEAAAVKTSTTIEKTKETVIIKEEKKKRSKLPWLILLLLLIGLGVAGFYYKDKIMAYFDKGETPVADSTATNTENIDENDTEDMANLDVVDHSEDIINPDSALVDMDSTEVFEEASLDENNDTEDPIEEPVIEDPVIEEAPPVVSGSNNGTYHLIGNSFGEEVNANRYVKKMEEKGYPAKVLGRFDGLYMVSLKSFDTREDANAGRSGVTADAGSAWVFKYPK